MKTTVGELLKFLSNFDGDAPINLSGPDGEPVDIYEMWGANGVPCITTEERASVTNNAIESAAANVACVGMLMFVLTIFSLAVILPDERVTGWMANDAGGMEATR